MTADPNEGETMPDLSDAALAALEAELRGMAADALAAIPATTRSTRSPLVPDDPAAVMGGETVTYWTLKRDEGEPTFGGLSCDPASRPFGCMSVDEPCVIGQMHHLDDQGRHYCPTGFLWCYTHAGSIVAPEDVEWPCTLWEAKP